MPSLRENENTNGLPSVELKQCQYPGCSALIASQNSIAIMQVCSDHDKCIDCGQAMSFYEIEFRLKPQVDENDPKDENGNAIFKPFDPNSWKHTRCSTINKLTSVTQSELDFLNICKLMVYGDPMLDNETLGRIAAKRFLNSDQIINQDFDQKIKHLERMRGVVDQLTLVLSKDKSSTIIISKETRSAKRFSPEANLPIESDIEHKGKKNKKIKPEVEHEEEPKVAPKAETPLDKFLAEYNNLPKNLISLSKKSYDNMTRMGLPINIALETIKTNIEKSLNN